MVDLEIKEDEKGQYVVLQNEKLYASNFMDITTVSNRNVYITLNSIRYVVVDKVGNHIILKEEK